MSLAFWRRKQRGQQLTDELQTHLRMAASDRVERGQSAQEAAQTARREFGNVELVQQVTRDQWGWVWLEQLLQDVRYAARMLRKNPGFTAVAVLTLALGIGANTAMFTFVDTAMLRALPVREPQSLVIFSWTAHAKPKIHGQSSYGDCEESDSDCSFSVPFFQTVRAQASTFSGVAAFAGPLDVDVSGNGPGSIAKGEFVSGDFFQTLGIETILGRPLGQEDDSKSASPVIVLNYGYWLRAFGGDSSVVGRVLRLNNVSAQIIGVAGPQFRHLTPGKTQDFFMPLSLEARVRSEWWREGDRLGDAAIWWVVIAGRLKPGVSIEEAQAAVTTLFQNETLRAAKPAFTEADAPTVKLTPAAKRLWGEVAQIAPSLYLTMAAAGLVLLIACANVAGLMLARSGPRQKEMAVRLALGAGRGRLVGQLLTESIMVSALGGALGVMVAMWSVAAIAKMIASGSGGPFPFTVAPDWRVLLFATAATLTTGILSGVAPALRGARVDLTPALKQSSSLGSGGRGTWRWFGLGDALVVAQVTLSVVVLFGAGLLVHTVRNLRELNPGFDTRNVLLFSINPILAGYTDQQTDQLYRNLQATLAALPGVNSVSYSESALLSGGWSGEDLHLDTAAPKSNIHTDTLPIGLDFFATMRIPLIAGRPFTPEDFVTAAATEAAMTGDGAGKPGVSGKARRVEVAPIPVIVNEMFARKYFAHENPIGKHIGNGQEDEPAKGPQPGYLIVGVVGNTKYSSLRRTLAETMYRPLISSSADFELRTAAEPTLLINAVRDIVFRAGSNLPIFKMRTQTEQVQQTLFQESLTARLFSIYAVLALTLACIGLYGLLSYQVTQRTREIGIRTALGADRKNLLRLVAAHGIRLALTGGSVGIGLGIGFARYAESLLYGVQATDPLTFVRVTGLLLGVTLAACYVPARRATRVDPIVALRYE